MAEKILAANAKRNLAHVLWIGGATDSGKSTVARNLAEQWEIRVYHYDRFDAEQTEHLAKTLPEVAQFLQASLEERWVQQSPQQMLDLLLFMFPHRFPLLVQDLLEMPGDKPIIVEGFGLLPELIQPILSNPCQAIWYVPTEKFKWESMIRRNKPSFAAAVSDPDRARRNLFMRDMMLADYYRRQAAAHGYTLLEVDGSLSAGQITSITKTHFSRYLPMP